jgi:hypothetical protein
VKLTRSDPTEELIGPKNGKMIAKNQMGITTGNLAAALLHKLLHSCIPIAFSHTKYNGVHANPNVINCKHMKETLLRYLCMCVCVSVCVHLSINIRIHKCMCTGACLVDEH